MGAGILLLFQFKNRGSDERYQNNNSGDDIGAESSVYRPLLFLKRIEIFLSKSGRLKMPLFFVLIAK